MNFKLFRLASLVVASGAAALTFAGALVFIPEIGGEAGQAHADGGRLSWQTSLASGSQQAKQEHKFVLADVYTDWCHWCKKLDKDVFTNSELVSYLQKDFVCVKVNAEDPREGSTIARVYKVDGFPCALVFSPEGKLIGRLPGYSPAKGYIAHLQQITGQSDQVSGQQFGGQANIGQQFGGRSNSGQANIGQNMPVPMNVPVQSQPQTQEQQMKELEQLQKQWQQQNQQQQQQNQPQQN